MKKGLYCVLIFAMMISVLTGCGKKNDTAVPETTVQAEQLIQEQQALDAITKYCYAVNPDLEGIVKEGQYPVYWEIVSSDENEIVVLFRSYTGAQNRFYIDRNTGETYVTEFVPGITEEESRTDEQLNVKDYL